MNTNFLRFLTGNFITSLVITYAACFTLATIGLNDVLIIGNLFGLYFLVIYGQNIAVEEGYIENNKERGIFSLCHIIIFDIVFIILMPILFNYDLFLPGDYINIAYNGFEFNFMLNSFFYMFIFAIVILIFNYILYKANLIK